MAPLAGDRLRPGAQAAADHDAAAATGTHDDAENERVAAPGAMQCFRQGKAVGVVFNSEWMMQRCFEQLVQRLAVEAHRVRVFQ